MVVDKNTINEYEKFKEKSNLLFNQLWLAKMQYDILDKKYDLIKAIPYAEIIIVTEDAIITSIIIKLAKIFDIDNRGDSITLNYILNAIQSQKFLNKGNERIINYVKEKSKEIKSVEILNLLKELRDKYHAHLDKNYMREEYVEIQIKEREMLNELKIIIEDAINILKVLLKEVFNEEIDQSLFERKVKEQEDMFNKMFFK